MATFIEDRFSFDDLNTEISPDGLPPFPELDSAAELGKETGGSGTEETSDLSDPKAENADDDTNDTNVTRPANGTGDTNDNNDRTGPTGSGPDGSEGLRQGYLPQRAVELLPELLAGPARRIGDRRKRDVFLTGALPVWAGALANVRFRYGGTGMSPNLYSAVIAPPASGKSALRHARAYGKPLSEELRAGGLATGTDGSGAPGSEEPGDPGPARRRLFLAADSSAAALKERLAESPHGVICETEFRTLSQALESSWGTFSDVLLKGFQNETIKTDRSSKETVTISHPAPSIALAGTPATFEGVISGTADGLFSRFLLYRFDREFKWSPQFGGSDAGPQQSLQEAAEEFQVGYHQLRARVEPLRITVPERLQEVHDRTFRSLTEKWQSDDVPRSLQASLTRSGLQAVKIAVVLRGIRLVESGTPPSNIDEVPLSPEDMEAGLRLALTYLLHGVRVETRFREEASPREGLTERKRRYLEALPEDTFSTKEAKELASRFGASERNAQRWLKAWREAGLLAKPKRGTWAKLSPKLEGIAGARSVISVINDIPALTSGMAATSGLAA